MFHQKTDGGQHLLYCTSGTWQQESRLLVTLCRPSSGFQIWDRIGFLGSKLFCQRCPILSDYCPKNEWYISGERHSFVSKLLRMQFYHLQKRTIVWGIKRRNTIFWEAASFFIAPFIDFSSHQKFQFLLVICECVYVGFLLNNCSLHLLSLFFAAPTLFIFMSIKQADTCHPPPLYAARSPHPLWAQ